MTDIALCNNKDCPSRLKCKRFTTEPSMFQWYQDFKPKDEDYKCEFFEEELLCKQYKNFKIMNKNNQL